MIYRLHISEILPGRIHEYLQRSEVGINIQEKYGAKLIGQWRPITGSMKRVITLWAYPSIASWEECRNALKQDAKAAEFAQQELNVPTNGDAWIELLEPTEQSPLQ